MVRTKRRKCSFCDAVGIIKLFVAHASPADHVLQQALDPKTDGVPKDLFAKCIGLLLISVVEVGFIFSGSVGTGILLKKNDDGSWSKPCAMGLGGMGWGFLVGAAAKDIMVFIFDQTSMNGMLAEAGVRIGGQLNLTVGPIGRNYEGGIGVSTAGAVGTFSIAFSKGAFISLSVEGAIITPRGGANDNFYGKVTTPNSIIMQNDVEFPESRPTLIQSVYDGLAKLQEGKTYVPSEEEAAQKAAAASAAQAASEEVAKSDPSVQKVNIEEEAKKEATK
jgi:lipid-binding SYLF domain-containing protein